LLGVVVRGKADRRFRARGAIWRKASSRNRKIPFRKQASLQRERQGASFAQRELDPVHVAR
jgi:hypothetical protein